MYNYLPFVRDKVFKMNDTNENHLQRIQNLPLIESIDNDYFAAFRFAAENGHLNLINYFAEQAPEKIDEMICACPPFYEGVGTEYYAFRFAVRNGHLNIVKRLLELSPRHQLKMLCADDFEAFQMAAGNGHLTTLEYLIHLFPKQSYQMIAANCFSAFHRAAGNGHLSILHYLIRVFSQPALEMMAANHFTGFQKAAGNGHLDVLDYFIKNLPHQTDEIIAANSYAAFRYAAQNGHLNILRYLANQSSKNLLKMLSAERYAAFRMAAENGHIEVMSFLIELAPEKQYEMIYSDEFSAFRYAAKNGQLHTVEMLLSLNTLEMNAMVKAYNFGAFRLACEYGHLMIVEHLIEIAGENKIEMLSANHYHAFQFAALNGHLAIIERLVEVAGNYFEEMLQANEFGALRKAVNAKQIHIVNQLLHFPSARVYAETHMDWDDDFLMHLNKWLLTLTSKNHDLLPVIHMMIRNLIKKNSPDATEKLHCLFAHALVKAQAHLTIEPHYPNELLRLAMSINNLQAVMMLLEIPEVYRLAANHHFYQAEQHPHLDLRALAEDDESSMNSLTPNEQQQLQELMNHYQPQIEQQGMESILEELRNQLKDHYQRHPATVLTPSAQTILLPFEFSKFQALEIDTKTYALALESYYQNTFHTAYRYLLKPNPWMSPVANYIHVENDDSWSTFENFQDLIALMFLAAGDKKIHDKDGYTPATRLENFFRELAYIGRAHNWDNSRQNPFTGKSESFDDLEGDKPSCYSGVKRRLFQSVHGHPLLSALNLDILYYQARDDIRNHFMKIISPNNCVTLHQAWVAKIQGDTSVDCSILDILNLSDDQKMQIVDAVANQYGSQFDKYFKNFFISTLTVKEPFKNLAEKFGGEVDLLGLLEQKKATYSLRFFENPSNESSSETKRFRR